MIILGHGFSGKHREEGYIIQGMLQCHTALEPRLFTKYNYKNKQERWHKELLQGKDWETEAWWGCSSRRWTRGWGRAAASAHPTWLLHHQRVRVGGCRKAGPRPQQGRQSIPRQSRGGGDSVTELGASEKVPKDESGHRSNGTSVWVKAEKRLRCLAHDNRKPSRWKSAVRSSLAWRSALEQVSFSAMQHEPQADQQGNHPVTVAKNTLEQKTFQGRPGPAGAPSP